MKFLHLFWIIICSCILLSLEGFRFPDRPFSPAVYGVDTIVSVQNLGVRRDFTTGFSFQLREGDKFRIVCAGCDYYLNNKNLKMDLLSTDDPSKNREITAFELRDGVDIELTGSYNFSISTPKKFTRIDELTLTAEGISSEERSLQWLNVSNIYIGNEEEGKNQSIPRFELFLEKGDSLHFLFTPVSESVPEVLTVELARGDFGGKTPLNVEADGSLSRNKAPAGDTYFFSIRAEKQKLGGIFNKDLFNPTKDFYNIQAVRIPKPEPINATTQGQGTSELGGIEDLAVEEGSSIDDMIVALTKSLTPKETPGLMPLPGGKIKQTVPGSMQLNSSSRQCTQIPIAQDADVMVYWLGTGAGAEREFGQIERERQRLLSYSNDKLPSELLGMYAHSILIKKNPDKYLFQSPREDSVFREYIDFVILDKEGKLAFEQGGNPTPRIDSRQRKKLYYNYKGDLIAEPLFLCLCNHNRYTPVDVTFMYSLYNEGRPVPVETP